MTDAPLISIDWNKLSEMGLIYKINKDVLHPLGLALTRNPDTGMSEGCIIDTVDFEFTYDYELTQRNEKKLQEFMEHRLNILQDIVNSESSKN